jgi:hypothetical protein
MGIFKSTTFLFVSAQSIEVTAESIPPETPTTKPSVLLFWEYAFNQETMCAFTFSNERRV